MTDRLVLAFFRFARCQRLCGGLALQNLPPGLCSAADDYTARLKKTQGVDVEGTKVMCFGVKVGVVAVQPIDAALRFEVRLLQNPPDARTPQSARATLQQSGAQIVETPAGGWAVVRGRFTGGHRHHIQTL